ncbi:MAG: hypothetical protein IKM73_13500 [Acidaminococcaceae bacterium]|nr:hypothetical protein [Acidaminococcaceae bacterium]
MKDALNEMIAAMHEAGCGSDEITNAELLYQAGRTKELIRHLRKCRCELMEQLHESQRKVDRMDYLIRQTGKTMHE